VPDYSSDRPDNFYFGGGGDTFATPLALVALVLAGILILVLPRKYAVVPFLLAGLLIPLNVSLVVASLHFNANRLLLLVGWIRLLACYERYPSRLNAIDKFVLYGALVNSIAYVLAWREVGAIVNRLGFLCSALGAYFLLRSLIRTKEDVLRVIRVLAVVMAIVAPAMWYEHRTQHNLFSLVGAIEWNIFIREGRVRASGPFGGAIIAGTLGVVSIPLFVGLWWYGRGKVLATVGIVSSCVMMLASSSSTPIMSLPAGILALTAWRWRNKMRKVRWGIVALLVCLQVVMVIHSGAPVWFVIDRVSGLLGGSGWHRSELIDNFVRHFFEWCLIGTKNYPDWGWSMWDVDNAFVGAGLMGGLPGFILFLLIFVHAYSTIGVARRAAEESPKDARLIWAIGSALFANTMGFFGIVFYDQTIIAFYALLVMIQVTPTFYVRAQPQEEPPIGAWGHKIFKEPAWYRAWREAPSLRSYKT
jgi:hypothetical protein